MRRLLGEDPIAHWLKESVRDEEAGETVNHKREYNEMQRGDVVYFI